MDASAGEPSEPAADASVQAAGEDGLPPRFSMEMERWVASIRGSISAEDLRGIRLRRSTIEAATARLGGGHQGTVQLLKLILVWVQQNHHHLQRKRPRVVVKEEVAPAAGQHGQQLSSCPPGARANPGPGYEFPAAGAQDMAAAGGGGTTLMPSYQQPFTPPAYSGEVATVCPSAAAQCLFHLQSSNKSSVVVNSQPSPPGFGGQCDDAGAASHRTMAAPQRMEGVEASTTNEAPKKQQAPPSLEAAAAKPAPAVARQVDIPQRLTASDKRQLGAKVDENELRFLLQRELKQSDVDLGRIVLPRMEAKVHLPEVKTKYGISIPMEDMGTSRVWKMRYYL